MLKRLSSLGLVLILAMTLSFGYAVTGDQSDEEKIITFEDVNAGEWYYESVMEMAKRGIINGYDDNTFRPMAPVLKEEFAKMMVLALNLEIKKIPSTFVDVADGYWASPWIETARTYLTGYIRNGEYYYKPKEIAAREDMAVALVKGKALEVTDEMLSVLNDYEDKNLISPNLRDYMAAAVYHKVMIGYEENNKKYLKPKASLSRAEAAKLILSVVAEEEKIVFEDENLVVEEGKFSLKAERNDEGYHLSWDYKENENVKAYKVVASINNKTPSYPEDGYTAYVDANNYDLKVGSSYVNGDFDVFMPDQTYYISVTAMTEGDDISSDVLYIKMPNFDLKDLIKPLVKAEQTKDGILLSWDKIDHPDLNGYKVVASKSTTSPQYPNDGYGKWIDNVNTTQYLIEPNASYSGGDLGGRFNGGESYYFNITAVYDQGNVSGLGVKVTMPIKIEDPVNNIERTPVVTGKIENNKVVLSWSEISRSGLQGYKIVASKNNPNPVYQADGYAHWITNLNTKEKYLSAYTSYSGGDVGGQLMPGETYYFSVTAVYNDKKIPGNAIHLMVPYNN